MQLQMENAVAIKAPTEGGGGCYRLVCLITRSGTGQDGVDDRWWVVTYVE